MPIVVPVRLRYANIDLWFDPDEIVCHRGDHVIVQTERGQEMGLVIDEAFNVNEEELRAPLKPVLKVADEQDLERANELSIKAEGALSTFRDAVDKSGLDMKPVACEYLFDGDKIVCYFAADERVDFRELVRDLASSYKMRVDMRQIGVRDEARMVGGFGHCGQELCCKRFGGMFEPVSIRMAKEQDLPLNPSKISGACGRLMCCLRYEFDAYKDFKSRSPKRGALIDTPLGTAKVIDFNTPRELLTLCLENGKQFDVPLKGMCCKDKAGKCCSCCNEQGKQIARPSVVTREVLDKIDDNNLQLLLSQFETEQALSDLDFDAKAEPTPKTKARQDKFHEDEDAPKETARKKRVHKRTEKQDEENSNQQTQKAQAPKKRRRRTSTEKPESVKPQQRTRRKPNTSKQEESGVKKRVRRRPGDGGGQKNQVSAQESQPQKRTTRRKRGSSIRRKNPNE